jgi:DNA-binding response OmpR family regulator
MPKLLLIEDTRDLALLIQSELNKAGFEVQWCADGKLGLQAALEQPFELILLDWMLPGMDGIEILRRLQQSSASVPVIMLTARSEEADRVIGLEIGADDYLTKPFSMRELIARIHVQLRRAARYHELTQQDKNADQEMISYKGLVLNPASFQAALDGVPLELTRTEFDLLHLFLRNPGRAFSRTYLFETVWGASYIGGDRSVDNAILRLRKKLDLLGDAIETVWGIGYRLQAK